MWITVVFFVLDLLLFLFTHINASSQRLSLYVWCENNVPFSPSTLSPFLLPSLVFPLSSSLLLFPFPCFLFIYFCILPPVLYSSRLPSIHAVGGAHPRGQHWHVSLNCPLLSKTWNMSGEPLNILRKNTCWCLRLNQYAVCVGFRVCV